jgi:hypothetical protein
VCEKKQVRLSSVRPGLIASINLILLGRQIDDSRSMSSQRGVRSRARKWRNASK